jgi:hypothetical protein
MRGLDQPAGSFRIHGGKAYFQPGGERIAVLAARSATVASIARSADRMTPLALTAIAVAGIRQNAPATRRSGYSLRIYEV